MRRSPPCSGRRRSLGGPGDEAGFTLVEMAVAMFIMGIFMALVVTGMTHLINPTLQTEAIRDSSDQLDIAFLDMDSEVRYASEIWQPYEGETGANVLDGNWDVLFASTFNGAAVATCNELRYNPQAGELLESSWTEGATAAPGFKVIASDLTGTGDPFTPVNVTGTVYSEQELQVTLTAVSGSGGATEETKSQVMFTALNSTTNAYVSPTPGEGCEATWAET